LHCPPCARTVESSLRALNGVRAARVDYATKSAKIEFDEHTAPLQLIASTIASTPHMMGAGMNYGSRLALSVPDLKDEATAKTARNALAATPGVASVTPYAAQHTVSVQFDGGGKPTTAELIAALRKAGLTATTY
jgi:cation transport ATPase